MRSHLLLLSLALLAAPLLRAGELTAAATVTPPPAPRLWEFDFQERLRAEVRENNFDFDDSLDSTTDDGWLLQRVRLGLKLRPADWLTFYVQGQDAREIGSDRPNIIGLQGAEGDDPLDLRQAYVEVGGKPFSLRAGRQLLAFGDQRLVGPLEWANQSRSFDAIRLGWSAENWSLDVFTASVVRFDEDGFNRSDWMDTAGSRGQWFSGAYFSSQALGVQTTDAYVFHLSEDAAGGSSFVTAGTLWKGLPARLRGWEYEMELMGQAGRLRGQDFSAFAGHWGVGHRWEQAPWSPRLFLEYDYASGDEDPLDGHRGTFQNLFPTNHKYYGFMDLFSLQNVHHVALNLTLKPQARVTARLDWHHFWLATTQDAWYRANGVSTVRPVSPGAGRYAGSEIDFTVTWKALDWLSLEAGYSHFFAGDYLRGAGSRAADDADFAYLMATIEL